MGGSKVREGCLFLFCCPFSILRLFIPGINMCLWWSSLNKHDVLCTNKRKNLMNNISQINKKAQISNNLSFTAFHKFRNFLLTQKTPKIEQFLKGVWGIPLPLHQPAVVDCGWCGCFEVMMQNILKLLSLLSLYISSYKVKTRTSHTTYDDVIIYTDSSAPQTVTDFCIPATSEMYSVISPVDIYI